MSTTPIGNSSTNNNFMSKIKRKFERESSSPAILSNNSSGSQEITDNFNYSSTNANARNKQKPKRGSSLNDLYSKNSKKLGESFKQFLKNLKKDKSENTNSNNELAENTIVKYDNTQQNTSMEHNKSNEIRRTKSAEKIMKELGRVPENKDSLQKEYKASQTMSSQPKLSSSFADLFDELDKKEGTSRYEKYGEKSELSKYPVEVDLDKKVDLTGFSKIEFSKKK